MALSSLDWKEQAASDASKSISYLNVRTVIPPPAEEARLYETACERGQKYITVARHAFKFSHEILPEPEQRRLLFMLHNRLQLIVSL